MRLDLAIFRCINRKSLNCKYLGKPNWSVPIFRNLSEYNYLVKMVRSKLGAIAMFLQYG